MMQPLLIEIGVEELPAVPLLKELRNIEKKWANVLEKNALLGEFEFFYTPRRLTIFHSEFKMSQDDSVEEMFGAPMAIAYKDGVATKAAEGFARKCGVELSEISSAQKGGKEVLYYKKMITGKESKVLLEEMITEWINSLSFGKSMRWGSLSESFIRPIRWLNVMLGNQLVDMKLFDVASSQNTYVHRMSNFEPLHVENEKAYFEILKEGAVTLFQDERRANILNDFKSIEKKHAIDIEIDNDLLAEVVAITENPTALLGSFDEEFLVLPDEVIITSMKEHQRYFPVFKEGKLINKFVVVSNALTEDFSKVIEGNEKVLRPRLADGLFFYNNDLNNGLSTKGLEKVVFMDGLGSVQEKIAREEKIALSLFDKYLADDSKELLVQAINLAKADLMSEMVYEFTELQGLMGYYYATELDMPRAVAIAIKEQYLPDGEDSELPSNVLSAIVALSIKLDTLLALFSINQIPTGSRDPFALRRAVNGIIKIVNEFNFSFDFMQVFRELSMGYEPIDFDKLEKFILDRIYSSYKVNDSLIKAVLATGERDILEIDKKLNAVVTLVESELFDAQFSTFKRLANISKDEDMSVELHVDESLFESEHERALFNAYKTSNEKTYSCYEEQLDAIFDLKPELDAFFDNVMVNAEDEKIKNNRKALIASIYKSLLSIADIKEISI